MVTLRIGLGNLKWFACLTLVAGNCAAADPPTAVQPTAAQLEFFEKKVRPILANNCYNCHSADNKAAGGLRVDDRNGLIAGGGRGPAVKPGNPAQSWLIKAVSYTDEKLRMPPDNQLAADEVAVLTQWIQDGAAWPPLEVPDDLLKRDPAFEERKKNHWAWQPLRQPAVPDVGAEWPRDDIDRFVLSKLNTAGLKPVKDADKLALIRRLSLDLTGLTPTQDEIIAFLIDDSAHALETVVDRLLASEAFGERWGRHWLDVARYAESTGPSRNIPYPHAWRYRDYVIDAFNTDKPYDEFIREQIAGDLLPANSPAQKAEQLVATGFLALGVKDVNQRFEVRFVMDNVDEQIDTVSRSILGLTVSCARCHDHKFDPIPTSDYYALAGIFESTELCDALRNQMGGGGLAYYVPSRLIVLGDHAGPDEATKLKIDAAREAVKVAQAEFVAFRDRVKTENAGPERQKKLKAARQKFQQSQAALVALTDPAATGPVALGVRDSKKIGDTPIRIRGEAEKLGPVVARGFLSLLELPDQPRIKPDQRGRLELARWLTSDSNALAPRVVVNRVWQHLFGEGLVTTVDNFGVTGDQPTHPELLDYLAGRFVRDGRSFKKLIRAIVLSRTYQLSSASRPENLAADPANRLLWRHRPRRLDAEELRDAILATSGDLRRTRPVGSPAKDMVVREIRNNGAEAKELGEFAAASLHRSIYLPLLRGLAPNVLQVFDFADQQTVTGHRQSTTIAPQSLYLLNDAFVRRQSLVLAERLRADASLDDAGRVARAYRSTIGRQPTKEEIARVAIFFRDYESAIATEPEAVRLLVRRRDSQPTPQSTDAKLAKKAPPDLDLDPDNVDREDQLVQEAPILAADVRSAAWAGFVQSLYCSAEFRYVK